MMLKNITRELGPAFSKIENILSQKISWLIWFVKSHYTWLSVLVLLIMGGIFIFTVSWICRYDRWDFWRWKRRAVFSFVRYALTLCVARILILIL